MKSWGSRKETWLRINRGVGYEDLINEGQLVGAFEHKHDKDLELLIFVFRNDVWVVPHRKDDGQLMTMYPSRKYRKAYFK